MKILICQIDIIWESKIQNLRHYEDLINDFFIENSGVNLIVFPEFFTSGFSFDRNLAEDSAGETITWIKTISTKYNTAILASIPFFENDNYYNRAIFIYQDYIECYNKRHLFSYGGENNLFSQGNNQTIINYMGFRIFPQICYDLRFPVWSRNVGLKYDLIIYMANWPRSRANVIEPLVRARAIENLSYTIFVNRVGNDPLNFYEGSSLIVNYKGEIINTLGANEQLSVVYLNLEEQYDFRNNFNVWLDSDKFIIE